MHFLLYSDKKMWYWDTCE